jgi:SAM-dependent methyltransferase
MTNTHENLNTMSPTSRFSDRAEDYAKYRPSYSDQIVTSALADLGPYNKLRVVDIGAGTGISSNLLAQKGASVIAVEPNDEMLHQGKSRYKDIEFVKAKAESTGLPSSFFNLVTCFQSFHWFNSTSALHEFHRIVRPGGRVALAWNVRITGDAFTADYSRIIDEYGDPGLIKDLNSKHETGERLLNSTLFVNGRKAIFPYGQWMDLMGLLGRLRSVSYLPKSGAVYDELQGKICELHKKYADESGGVTMQYSSMLYMADRQERAASTQ